MLETKLSNSIPDLLGRLYFSLKRGEWFKLAYAPI
jgi:hypothetical protein